MRTSVYRYFDATGTLLYVGMTARGINRVTQHARKQWFDSVVKIEIVHYRDRHIALEAERMAILTEKPLLNRDLTPPRGHSVSDEAPAA